jgi:hypothetical protein
VAVIQDREFHQVSKQIKILQLKEIDSYVEVEETEEKQLIYYRVKKGVQMMLLPKKKREEETEEEVHEEHLEPFLTLKNQSKFKQEPDQMDGTDLKKMSL